MKFKLLASSALVFSLTLTVIPSSVEATPVVSSTKVAQASTQITEANVQSVVKQLQAARVSEDIEGTLKLLAPFAVTDVTVQTGNGITTVITHLEGTAAHRQMLEQSFGKVQSRKVLKNYVTINIISNDFGMAKIYQIENLETQDGKSFVAASETILRLGRVDGQVLITSATVEGWISERPSQK
ncbi:MAG TPA: hypothetical protein IGS53_00645 [Leptolyngbyaceae cyanobacterium M33_DOE_097]|nr:hypothetical protein [Leptolyngbyaceae cyanobacterium M33_DOE_097]